MLLAIVCKGIIPQAKIRLFFRENPLILPEILMRKPRMCLFIL